MASELKPCAHCNGAAELDYEQPFCAFPSGKMEKQVAIYCTVCDVHMSMCYSDFPEYDHDQMAAILTEKWNTRPVSVATGAGLVTIGYVLQSFVDGEGADYNEIFRTVREPENWTATVTRSQAEELLAAERAEKERLADDYQAIREQLHRGWRECKDLKADNAAKDARIKALEADLKIYKQECADLRHEKIDAVFKDVDLEAKLMAAEKALEPLADIADLIDAETEGMAETDELVLHFHDYEFAKWPVSLFRKARAVLGGQKRPWEFKDDEHDL